jgi:hypothetical protein
MRLVTTLLVAALVVVAGCTGTPDPAPGPSGGGDGDAAAPDTQPDGTPTVPPSTPQTAEPSAGDDGGGDEPASEWNRYAFRTGDVYEYEVYSETDGAGTLRWEVLDASEASVTLQMDYDTESVTFSQTVTAAPDEVFASFFVTPVGPFLSLSLTSPYLAALEDEELAVGEGFEYAGPDGTASVRVERLATYGGLQCYDFVTRHNGSIVYESCVAADHPFPAHTAVYDAQTDERLVELTLVAHRRG